MTNAMTVAAHRTLRDYLAELKLDRLMTDGACAESLLGERLVLDGRLFRRGARWCLYRDDQASVCRDLLEPLAAALEEGRGCRDKVPVELLAPATTLHAAVLVALGELGLRARNRAAFDRLCEVVEARVAKETKREDADVMLRVVGFARTARGQSAVYLRGARPYLVRCARAVAAAAPGWVRNAD